MMRVRRWNHLLAVLVAVLVAACGSANNAEVLVVGPDELVG